MNIYVAMSLFAVTVFVYWVITELFTLLFRLTGLPDERARFQIISLLTGCGYTTKESEMFLSSRARRRLARITMLFGYAFNITVVSAFINVFLSMKVSQLGNFFASLLIPIAVITLILVFIRVPRVRAWGDARLRRLADRIVERGETYNSVMPVDYIGADSIARVCLKHIPEAYLGVRLADLGLRAETGILVMVVEHADGKAEAAGPDTVFSVGDTLTVFGEYAKICTAFHARESFDDLFAEEKAAE